MTLNSRENRLLEGGGGGRGRWGMGSQADGGWNEHWMLLETDASLTSTSASNVRYMLNY